MSQVAHFATWMRGRNGEDVNGVVHHSDAGSQYTSIRFTLRLADAGPARRARGEGPATPSRSSIRRAFELIQLDLLGAERAVGHRAGLAGRPPGHAEPSVTFWRQAS
jgi:transposase InsO family protein